jgi:hypothetical protein
MEISDRKVQACRNFPAYGENRQSGKKASKRAQRDRRARIRRRGIKMMLSGR